jgi:hypothetical protein
MESLWMYLFDIACGQGLYFKEKKSCDISVLVEKLLKESFNPQGFHIILFFRNRKTL